MKVITEKDYESLGDQEKSDHHKMVRNKLIESGLLIPRKEKDDKAD